MKSILISIKPKYVADILNGRKSIEIRKNMPKCELPITVYIYCTKEDNLCCIRRIDRDRYICGKDFDIKDFPGLSSGYEGKGKVVAMFTLNKVVRYVNGCKLDGEYSDYEHVLKPSCLTEEELYGYCDDLSFYAWHISNLVIFDKPKELNEFKTRHYPQFAGMVKNKTHYELRQLTKAPQSWAYIESEE